MHDAARLDDPVLLDQERTLLELERSHIESRIRGLGRHVEPASGGFDAEALRNMLHTRRDRIIGKLKELPLGDEPRTPGVGPEVDPSKPLDALPIAAALFGPGDLDIGGFGYSGTVQMPRPTEGGAITPGKPGTSGAFETARLRTLGGISFNGHLTSNTPWDTSDSHWPDSPVLNSWWKNWTCLVPLPPPAVPSILTYRFNVAVQIAVVHEHGVARFVSGIAVRHVPNLTLGTDATGYGSISWPLSADLEIPVPGYNGTFGMLSGSATVHGSLWVAAGANPALRIYFNVYGVIGDLVNHEAECDFHWGSSDSLILPQDDAGHEGRITFHYEPQPILAPDFDER